MDEEDTTEWFKIRTGIKQGCNMSGLLFLLVVDWVMRKTLQESNTGIGWKITTELENLNSTDKLTHEAGKVGLKVKMEKCKLLQKFSNK